METNEPSHHQVSVADQKALRIGTLNGILRAIGVQKKHKQRRNPVHYLTINNPHNLLKSCPFLFSVLSIFQKIQILQGNKKFSFSGFFI